MNKIPSSVKNSFIIVFFIFLFLYIFTKIFGPIPFSVNSINTTKTDLFTAQGTGEATVVPDTALMNIGVTKNSRTIKSAQDEVNSSINTITQGLKDLGIDEKKIKTTNYSIHPNYDYSNDRNTITDYSVTQNIRVEVSPIDKANEALDLASTSGANMIGDIQFTVNDKKRLELENTARTDAIKKAKEKANSIAQTAGIRLGKLINVQESGNAYPEPYYDSLRALPAGGGSQKTELQPGESSITVSVTLSYETL